MKPVIKYSGPEARSYDEKTRTIWHKIGAAVVFKAYVLAHNFSILREE
jgi:hypothetical protein